MKKTLTLLFSLFAAVSLSAQNGFDYLSLSRKACSDTDGKYKYYISEEFESEASSSVRLVFVDTNPGAGWNHSCAKSNTCIQVVSSSAVSSVKNYSVEAGALSCVISIPNMEHGIYQVSLLEGKEIIDTRKVIKQ